MEAFAAGKVDAVMMTMGDALVTGAPGRPQRRDPRHRLQRRQRHDRRQEGHHVAEGLKGKKIGLEIGLVEHLMLLKGLEKNGMKESDVKLVAVPHEPDGAGAGLGRRRRHRRVAAQRRPGAEGGAPARRPCSRAPTFRASSTTWCASARRAWPSAAPTG